MFVKTLCVFAIMSGMMSDCLSDDLLKKLDLVPKASFNAASEKICTGLFATVNACVDLADFQTKLQAKKAAIQKDQTSKLKGLGGQMKSINAKITNICTRVATKKEGDKLGKITIDADLIATCAKFTANASLAETQSARLLNADTRKKCVQSINKLSNGVFCVLASADATKYVTVSSSGAIDLKVPQTAADAAFNDCIETLSSACTLSQLGKIVSTISQKPIKNQKIATACKNFDAIEKCVADVTQCSADVKKEIFQGFFSPFQASLGDTVDSTVATDADSADTSTATSPTSRLLQTSTDSTNSTASVTTVTAPDSSFTVVSDGGFDVTANTGISTDVVAEDTTGSVGINSLFVAIAAVAVVILA